MYSILISKIIPGMRLCYSFLKQHVNENSKVLILPWAFPNELNIEKFDNEYFKVNGDKYNKYINPLLNLSVEKKNIFIANPYKITKEELIDLLNKVDVLVLPGGNPEMFFHLVVHKFDILYKIKYFQGIIIGESAGAELHLERYFITAKNNYYKYFAFYDGFGILKDPFYFDVHSSNNQKYLNKLQNIAKATNKRVFAIFNDGAIIINRQNQKIKCLGQVKEFKPNNEFVS